MLFTSNDTHTNSLKSKIIPTLFRLNNGISISKANSTKRARNQYRIKSLPVDFDLISRLTYEWVKRVQMEEKIRVTNSMIRLASTEIARSKEMHGFKGSKGWIYRFKKRHLLLFDKSTIEGVSNRDLYFDNNCRSLCATSSRILNEIIEEDDDYDDFEPIDDYKSEESDSNKESSSSDYFDIDQMDLDMSRKHGNFERVTESEMTYMFSRMRSYCEQSSPQLLPHLNTLENLFYDRD